MNIDVIHTNTQHEAALRLIAPYFDQEDEPLPNTPEGDRFLMLAMAIEAYEKKCFTFDLPDPIAAIKFRMEQANMTQADLAPLLGGANRVSEILNKRRALTMEMVRNLVTLGIPAAVLVQEYKLVPTTSVDQSYRTVRVKRMEAPTRAAAKRPATGAIGQFAFMSAGKMTSKTKARQTTARAKIAKASTSLKKR